MKAHLRFLSNVIPGLTRNPVNKAFLGFLDSCFRRNDIDRNKGYYKNETKKIIKYQL